MIFEDPGNSQDNSWYYSGHLNANIFPIPFILSTDDKHPLISCCLPPFLNCLLYCILLPRYVTTIVGPLSLHVIYEWSCSLLIHEIPHLLKTTEERPLHWVKIMIILIWKLSLSLEPCCFNYSVLTKQAKLDKSLK